jgi:D-arabinose 1-dehydrogenase-like Zn-dependent alcohol dehydrogenase
MNAIPATMRAAVYHGPGDVRITAIPVPEPGPGEVLVKVGAASQGLVHRSPWAASVRGVP